MNSDTDNESSHTLSLHAPGIVEEEMTQNSLVSITNSTSTVWNVDENIKHKDQAGECVCEYKAEVFL